MTTIATTGAHQTEPVPAGHESGYNRSLLGEMFSQPSSSEDVSSAAIIDRKDTVTTATTTTPMTTGAATAGETQAVRYAPMEPHESYPSWEDSFDFLADFWKSEPGLASEEDFLIRSPDYSGSAMMQLSSPQVSFNHSSIGDSLPFASRYVQDIQPAEHSAFNSTEYELQFNQNQTKSEEMEGREGGGGGAVGDIPQNNINNDFMFLSPARKRTIQETLSKKSANSLGHMLESKVIPDNYNGVPIDQHQQQPQRSIAIPKPPLLKIQDYTNELPPSEYSTESVFENSLGCPSYLSTSMSSMQTLSTSFDSTPEKRTNPSTPGTSVWRLNNGELINEIPTKRRRTETEKAVTARIRKGGGACNNCRKNHRACKIEHLGIQDTEKYSESETASRDSSWRMSNDKMPADNSGSFNDQTRRRGGRGGSDGKNGDFFQGEPSKGDFTADFQGNDNTLFLGQFSYQPDAHFSDTRLFNSETPYDVNGSNLAFQDILDGFNPFEF